VLCCRQWWWQTLSQRPSALSPLRSPRYGHSDTVTQRWYWTVSVGCNAQYSSAVLYCTHCSALCCNVLVLYSWTVVLAGPAPFAGIPIIDYTLEWLAAEGVEECFILCCAHADQVSPP